MQIWSLILAKVDPFVIQWPSKWMQDDEIRPVIQYLDRWLHDMFVRSGGGDDTLGDLEVEGSGTSTAMISRLSNRLSNLEQDSDNTMMLASIIKRIKDIENTQEPTDTAAVNSAIKSTIDKRYALLVS